MTPIPGPIILLALPLLAAGVAYLVRRLAVLAAFLSAATTALLAILCLRLPLDRSAFVLGQEVAFGRPVVVLGQTLLLEPAGQMWLVFVFGLTTIFYLLAWRISQGRSFFPFSLVILAQYALVVMVQTFALAVLIFAISATLTVFILQAGQPASVRGAQRYLLVTLLAAPLLLAASWLVDQALLGPQDAEALANGSSGLATALAPVLARRALLPAALGFGLLLAVFPFGTWMPALAADAPPIVAAFVFTVGQAMVLFLALLFLRTDPDLLSGPSAAATLFVIQVAGLGMVASGGVMAAVQRDLGRLFGYAALSDLGIVLLAFGLGGSQRLTLVLLHTANRSVAITLMAAALAIVRHRAATDQFAGLQGMARRLPIATVGLLLGGLALAGFPFTAGFPTRWAVSRAVWNWAQPFAPRVVLGPLATGAPGVEAVPGQEWVWILTLFALLAASTGIVVGLLRGLGAMLGPDPRNGAPGGPSPTRQPLIASIMVLALAALAIVVGLYPQLFLGAVTGAAQALSLF